MTVSGRLARFALSATLVVVVGCGLFDDRPSRRGGGGYGDRDQRCPVDLEQWEARVERFKDKEHRDKESFRQVKEDLLRDLERLDTAPCRREIRRQVSDLIDDVREERY